MPYDLPPCDHHCSGQYPPCDGDAKTPKCVKECNSYYNKSYTSDIHKGKNAYTVP